MPRLIRIDTVTETHRYSQAEVLGAVRGWLNRLASDVDPRAIERLFSRSGVENRSSLRPIDEVFREESFAVRNELYRAAIVTRCTGLAELTRARAGLQSVGAIVSSSCTGFMIPAVDAHIANHLKLGPWVVRLPITEAGCAGGAVALARAHDYLVVHPEQSALAIASEYSSLTFQAREATVTNLVATALFADGSASAALVGDASPDADRGFASLEATASAFLEDHLGAMGYDVVPGGLRLVLDKRLPDALRGRLATLAQEFLHANGTSIEEVGAFAIHPGGRKVLDVAQEELSLDDTAMAASSGVLREHGNMSSATILFVLDRALGDLAPGGRLLAIGFGPGFGIEFSLWKKLRDPGDDRELR